ncbi:hydroxymethylglutaryl-CoA lyase [Alteromonas gilva]|uniref:Hydroxymethylglutaryl-CoA lyase n=1 Tax=Alteromonas gilva TaxID=2987522 RepID=A0ABT5L2Q0_9ALTE|nr:hydroxymethylglutaryl-CoA lyase [Alteromonas gilva]MDC8831312.1 hydroxymethylglutaryl-CoA lyase [Alteromonas gilva]
MPKNKLPTHVSIVEVGARDGLQNEATTLPVSVKVDFINALTRAGLTRIEAGSFVSPRWVPQMADTAEVFACLPTDTECTYSALTPNEKGMQAAIAAGAGEVAVFAAASESFSQKNINCSIADSLTRFAPVFALAKQHNLPVRGYVSCVMGCPYEGSVKPEAVLQVSQALLDMGCYEISLGDTIGSGTPGATQALLDTLLKAIPASKLAVHFHDTYGQALANILVALQQGISVIDSAAGGLGGCPYAAGASGNVATEDVVYMLDGMGISSGVDLTTLVAASAQIFSHLNRPPTSKTMAAFLATCNRLL